jgi:hypothetical protein
VFSNGENHDHFCHVEEVKQWGSNTFEVYCRTYNFRPHFDDDHVPFKWTPDDDKKWLELTLAVPDILRFYEHRTDAQGNHATSYLCTKKDDKNKIKANETIYISRNYCPSTGESYVSVITSYLNIQTFYFNSGNKAGEKR